MNQMNQVKAPQAVYRAEIDGLRAFSVLSVVLFHAYPDLIPGGFIGVDVFFVISGFLITSHIFNSFDNRAFSFYDFYFRRARRIFPALILVILVCLLVGWFVLFADEYSQLGKHVASGSAFVLNFFLVKESGYFDNVAETKPLLHLWSLAVEEQFYIVWPFILWLGWRLNLNLFFVILAVSGLSFFWGVAYVESRPEESYFLPFGRFWELLVGSFLAWVHLYRRDFFRYIVLAADRLILSVFGSKITFTNGNIISNLAAIAGIIMLLYGAFYISEDVNFPGVWALVPTFGAVLVISAGSKSFINRVLFMNPISIWIGLISYPLYLWHWPILSFPRIILGEDLSGIAILFFLIMSLVASFLTYFLLELPIRRSKSSIKISLILLMLLASAGCFGLYVFQSDGLPLRSANNKMEVQVTRTEYLHYIDENYVDCEPKNIRELAPSWEGSLRCKQSGVGNPKVVLVGDSHAEHLFIGLADTLNKNVAYYISGLPIMARTKRKYIFDYIIENDNVETVILAARYELHLGRGDIIDLYDDMRGTVEAMKAANKSVVLVGDTPQYAIDPLGCIGRRFAKVSSSCSLTTNEIERQASVFQGALKRLADEYDVTYIDLFEVMCGPQRCSMIDNGRLLYRDRDHLSILGSQKAGSFIAEKLNGEK